jgi:hypothetical protein
MNAPQLIVIARLELEQIIREKKVETELSSNITCPAIREKIKLAWKDAKYSLPETYIFLGQYPNAYLYGLYKSSNNRIYIVKSFLDTILNVVPFNKKYFE